jgi:hypothetical protein
MSYQRCACTRRQALGTLLGSGSLLMSGILSELLAADNPQSAIRNPQSTDPLAPKAPHFPARAKRVIFLFMNGGVSHVDSFDPKPALYRDHNKTISVTNRQGKTLPFYLHRPYWEFQRRGRSGIEVSTLFPKVAECVDDLCVFRSLRADHDNHYEATLQMHTGSVTFARPSIGSWVSYGLGTVNRNLPSFVSIAPQLPYAGDQNWGADFLPACHQGTRFVPGPVPVADLNRRAGPQALQDLELQMRQARNRAHLEAHGADARLAARIRSFETAFGMQQEGPDVFDLSKESEATLKLYGLQRGSNQGFGWQCLVARRLAERGVRFVELFDVGSSNNWDAHGGIVGNHAARARYVDQAIAGLLRDLKQRGMFDDTLVVWASEFGRTPHVGSPNADGREHHPLAFSVWLAGAGVRGGMVYGATDEHGIRVAENPVHVHDFHATILHLMGLNHEKLTYRHAGRDFRLTDVHGRVVQEILV